MTVRETWPCRDCGHKHYASQECPDHRWTDSCPYEGLAIAPTTPSYVGDRQANIRPQQGNPVKPLSQHSELKKGACITGPAREKVAREAIRGYENGGLIRKLAEQFGRSYGFVHNILSEAGCPFADAAAAPEDGAGPRRPPRRCRHDRGRSSQRNAGPERLAPDTDDRERA